MTKKTFTYEEALEAFPAVREITGEAVARVTAALDTKSFESVEEIPDELITEYNSIVAEWTDAMTTRGLEVKGLWLVDFDSGSGYYCWRYPETALDHYHGYDEGFAGRVKLN
ncbi:MAG: DUF2203 domain-containing protein [Acidobacteria bacterium]|nr:DUF2203 domain-containing protein [Acidobacteriota bacterium]